MSYRRLPAPGDPEAVGAWMQSVADAIQALERQQPVFGPSIRIGDLELRTTTSGSTVHIYAVNTLTGASVMLA